METKLKQLFRELDITPYEVECDVTPRTIYNAINGHSISRYSKQQIAKALNVATYELFENEEKMKDTVYKNTLEVLKETPQARSNNKLLVAEVYKKICGTSDLSKLCFVKDVPAVESITRCRRSIVNDFPELRGVEQVEAARQEETRKYIEFNNYGLMED